MNRVVKAVRSLYDIAFDAVVGIVLCVPSIGGDHVSGHRKMLLVERNEREFPNNCGCGDDAVDQVNAMAWRVLSSKITAHLADP